MMKFLLPIFAILIFSAPPTVYADISLLLHESKGFSGEMTGDGHLTVYLSELCSDPPLVLRECRNDEPRGVVISTYPGVGANADYKWFVIPALPYFYGIDNPQQIPLYANGKIRDFLSESNRSKYMSEQIPQSINGKLPPGRWSVLFGTALNRDLYAFTVKTSPEQDLNFLKKYNISPEGNDFNVLTNNCADFSKNVLNFYFPESGSRDAINDFGITTPKAVGRSLKDYADKRPKLLFHIQKISQLDGSISRSSDLQSFTEMAVKSKKYLALQAFTMPVLIPFFAGTYFLSGGQFSVDAAYRKSPSPEMAALNLEKELSQSPTKDGDQEILNWISGRQTAEKARIFGTKIMWEKYRTEISVMLADAVKQKLFLNNGEIKSFYADLETQSEPFFDGNGDLMLKVNNYGEETALGLTRRNITSQDSDVRLAYKLMLAKVKYELTAPEKNRETLEVFHENWQLLKELSEHSAQLPPVQNEENLRFSKTSNTKKVTNKLVNLFRKITH